MRTLRYWRNILLVVSVLAPAAAYAIDMPPDEGGDEVVTAPAETPKTQQPAQAAPAPIEDETHQNEYDTVLLQGLDKVTGRTSKFSAIVGKPENFGSLEIITHRCWQSNPEDRPENAALLEVREHKPDEEPNVIFMGWMFSSSPGLSALEHPVYDITVLSCAAQPKPKTAAPKTPVATPVPAPTKPKAKAPAHTPAR
jgi:hypothetical protein